MDTPSPRRAGIDAHKANVVACIRLCDRPVEEIRTPSTVTRDLLALSDWLAEQGVTRVAMESTGAYWKPAFNILEGRCAVILVNAEHTKQVPGRKADVKDCQWIAPLLQHGLLKASFVPPAPARQLRDLTRRRAQLLGEKASAANRIREALGDANIKLAGVATDVLGTSGRAMSEALIAGVTDPEELAELARRRLRAKIPQLRLALPGRVTERQRSLLRLHLGPVGHLEGLIGQLSGRIEGVMAPFAAALARLEAIPGISRRVAQTVLAELGPRREQFPTAGQRASWAGMSPGNSGSARKRRGGHTAHGNRWLSRAPVQAAWAASRTRGTYLAARYRRLARRRGAKRALVAVGHTLLVIISPVLKKGATDAELGADFLERLGPERLTRPLAKRLESLGHKVTPQPRPAA